MSHLRPNLVSTSFLYNPYIPFLISLKNFLLVIIMLGLNVCGLQSKLLITPLSE